MRIIYKLFKWFVGLCLFGAVIGALLAGGTYLYFAPQLPDVNKLKDVRLQTPLRIYTSDNKLLAEFGEKRRSPVSYEQIPPQFVHALMAAEDSRFFQHFGIDPKGLARAAFQLGTTGHIQTGGSTITMQVARNYFLTRKRTFKRKFMEILLSLRMEHELSKKDIMELYVNKIYLGHRAYGIQAASTVYYGKPIKELDLAQMAMIAGLPKAPSAYNPIINPTRALQRRNWILSRMLTLGYINEDQYSQSVKKPITARYHGSDVELYAPYIAEMVRSELYARYGERLYSDGFQVYTTVDSHLQSKAQSSIQQGLIEYSERHGYFGAEKQIDLKSLNHDAQIKLLTETPTYGPLVPALVMDVNPKSATVLLGDNQTVTLNWDGLSWAREYKSANWQGPKPKSASDIVSVGDLIRIRSITDDSDDKKTSTHWQLSQIPRAQGALISLRSNDGAIQAMSGGFSFELNKFNRATQAYRQPGSNMKPFLYTAGLEHGYSPATVFNNSPVVFHDASLEGNWRPNNDNGKFGGPTRLREALYRSLNLVSIRLMRALGINNARNFILRFGFDPNRVPKNLSLALGTADVTPMQLATAYSTFSNGGYKIEPYVIDRIEDSQHNVISTSRPTVACQSCEQKLKDTGNKKKSGDESDESDESDENSYPQAKRIVSSSSDFMIYSMMQDVIKRGTGYRARVLKRDDLAGKTGTTNDQKDAWFSGYNASIATTAWVGFDQPTTLGRHEFGATAALPIWINYMRTALDGMPEKVVPRPNNVIRVSIDPKTGKRAYPGQKNAIGEWFKRGTAPRERARSPEERKQAPTTDQLFSDF